MSKESAEEKLFKMMQKSPSSVAGKPSSPAGFKKKFKFSFSINALNALLFACVVICIIALIFEMRSGFSLLNGAVQFPSGSRNDATLSDIALPSTPDVDYYLQQINQRDIFKPYVPKVAQKAQAGGISQLMSKYKLVGIAWLDLPETASVMIEDTQDNKTYFLRRGQQLDGVTVKTIYTDRAVFSHENEEITIKL